MSTGLDDARVRESDVSNGDGAAASLTSTRYASARRGSAPAGDAWPRARRRTRAARGRRGYYAGLLSSSRRHTAPTGRRRRIPRRTGPAVNSAAAGGARAAADAPALGASAVAPRRLWVLQWRDVVCPALLAAARARRAVGGERFGASDRARSLPGALRERRRRRRCLRARLAMALVVVVRRALCRRRRWPRRRAAVAAARVALRVRARVRAAAPPLPPELLQRSVPRARRDLLDR